jgi:hypothetical protein
MSVRSSRGAVKFQGAQGRTVRTFRTLPTRLTRITMRFWLEQETREGPYGIRTRAAAVRGRCPRPLDEWAVATAKGSGSGAGSRRLPARACRGASRSRAGCSRRWRARTRSARVVGEGSRCGRCRRDRRGSARMRRPHPGAEGGRASAVPTRTRDSYQKRAASETRLPKPSTHFAR